MGGFEDSDTNFITGRYGFGHWYSRSQ